MGTTSSGLGPSSIVYGIAAVGSLIIQRTENVETGKGSGLCQHTIENENENERKSRMSSGIATLRQGESLVLAG
jgi:hypothetical protein